MLVAMKSDKTPMFSSQNKEYDNYLSSLVTGNIPNDMPILMDEHAPVEYYIGKAMLK